MVFCFENCFDVGTLRKYNVIDRDFFCKFDAIGRQFAKIWAMCIPIQTVKDQNEIEYIFLTCYSGGYSDPIAIFKMLNEKICTWDVDNYRKK